MTAGIAIGRDVAGRHLDREPLVRPVAELLHDARGLCAVLLHVGVVARQSPSASPGGMPQSPPGGGCMMPPISPCPSARMSMNAWRSRRQRHRPPHSGLSNGGIVAVDHQVAIDVARRHLADRRGACRFDVLQQRDREPYGKIMSNLPATNARIPRRDALDDGVFDAVEIRPARLPVIRVAGHLDVFVRLELDELERARADRLLAHLRGRHMAGIDRRTSRASSIRKAGCGRFR